MSSLSRARFIGLLLAWVSAAQGQQLDRYLAPIDERRLDDGRQAVAWIRRAAHPIAELAPLAARLAEAEVIGLGEITHGSQEDMALKAQLLRLLVERHGLRLIALEANRAVGLRLQRFIDAGSTETDVAAALRDSGIFSVYRCEALGALLLWLRDWNREHTPAVRLVGIDVQDPGRDAQAAMQALRRLDPARAAALEAPLAELLAERVPHVSVLFPNARRPQWQRWSSAAAALENALRDRPDADEAQEAAWSLRMALQTFEFDVGTAGAPVDLPPEAFSRRDTAMAERLLRARRGNERAALWAHDTHVAANGYDMFSPSAPTVGKVLRERLGADGYLALNFSFRHASFHAHGVAADGSVDLRGAFKVWRITAGPGALGHALASTGLHSFWVDLRELPGERWALAFRQEPWRRLAFGDGVAPEQLAAADVGWPLAWGTDLLVHLDTLTPSRLYGPAQPPATPASNPTTPASTK
ncbi:erythromycin esterase family protein [Ideonella sp. 4Y11]|uniref:Erythromycin esterase family protein n=1 Tax=Ideonella aquatica TaxID=2824119 RepID=A0A940YF76_9BURK|nr:erythromycin esterase family protein [Ideonella aquatica]MBQ0959118.1 erythromycin esterase family protein [Ideonella aquatica]